MATLHEKQDGLLCPNCGCEHTYSVRSIEKTVRVGNDTVTLAVIAGVCQVWGEEALDDAATPVSTTRYNRCALALSNICKLLVMRISYVHNFPFTEPEEKEAIPCVAISKLCTTLHRLSPKMKFKQRRSNSCEKSAALPNHLRPTKLLSLRLSR